MKHIFLLCTLMLVTLSPVGAQDGSGCSPDLDAVRALLDEADTLMGSDPVAAGQKMKEASRLLMDGYQTCVSAAAGVDRLHPVPLEEPGVVGDTTVVIESVVDEPEDTWQIIATVHDGYNADRLEPGHRYIIAEVMITCDLDPTQKCFLDRFVADSVGSRGVLYDDPDFPGFRPESDTIYGGASLQMTFILDAMEDETDVVMYLWSTQGGQAYFALE